MKFKILRNWKKKYISLLDTCNIFATLYNYFIGIICLKIMKNRARTDPNLSNITFDSSRSH